MSVAELGGVTLPNHNAIPYEEIVGALPYVTTLELDREAGETLFNAKRGTEVILKIEDSEAQVVREFPVFLLRPMPASEPHFFAIEVGDLRVWWDRTHVLGRYNIRRKSGTVRIVRRDVLGNVQTVDDIEYHPYSLDPPFNSAGIPWTGDRTIADVLRKINSQLPEDKRFTFTVDPFLAQTPIEGLEIDVNGRTAIAQALKLIPELGLKVLPKKEVVVFNASDVVAASGQVDELGLSARGTIQTQLSDFAGVAPSEIHVYSSRELETRFDFLIERGNTAAPPPGLEPRRLENVLPVPDPDLPGHPPGTWITFDQAFELWGTNPVAGTNISHALLARQWMNPQFMHALGESAQQRAELTGDDRLWTMRMAAVRQHYYRTFRIPRNWVDRALRFQDYRVSIIDTETGTRAPAQAWSDFALRYGSRAHRLSKHVLLARNVDGYAVKIGDGILSAATVQLVSPDEGIIRIDYNVDPFGFAEEVVPSKLLNVPTAKIGNVARSPRFWSEIRGPGAAVPRLSSEHRLAVILSGVPAAPNDIQQLHLEKVKADDLDGLLTYPISPTGPIWRIRIPPNLETARYAWQDEQAGAIENAFGLREIEPEILSEQLRPLLVNPDAIRAVSVAAASIIFFGFRNRLMGSHTSTLNSTIELQGAMRRIRHVLQPDGRAFTSAELLDDLPIRELFSFLPRGILEAVLGLVK